MQICRPYPPFLESFSWDWKEIKFRLFERGRGKHDRHKKWSMDDTKNIESLWNFYHDDVVDQKEWSLNFQKVIAESSR